MLNRLFFKQIDNSALIIFRIIFGLLCFLESVGAIFTGWVTKNFMDPKFTFTFIGFEWLQPLSGNWMYVYYLIMGVFGLFIMIGYKYRFSIISFAILWTTTYLMQKSSYNNHYYLLILISGIMAFLPANKYYSLDVKWNKKIEQISMPQWCKLVIVLQVLIVFSYASIAKIYPDWLDLTTPKLLLKSKQNYPIIGSFLQTNFMANLIAYGGILFDGLIIPLMFIKATRKYAFILALFFNLFNAIVFQVGIFPFLSLGFMLFFFEPKKLRNIFLKKKQLYIENAVKIPNYKPVFLILFAIYFLIQVGLPLRHHFIKDNVLWTEEGHRLSWRMMLRIKRGYAKYNVVNNETGKKETIKLKDYLTQKQIHLVATKPDVIWQFAQHLKKEYAKKNENVSVYATCKISVNGRSYKSLVNPNVDLASVSWSVFKHNNWLAPQGNYLQKK
jgi:hypothetical protein